MAESRWSDSEAPRIKQFNHVITNSEIRYGMIAMRRNDGTYDFFKQLPDRFIVVLRGVTLFDRTMTKTKIWISFDEMRKFNPGEVLTISLRNNKVYID